MASARPIPVIVAARDEEATLGACLASLHEAIAWAEARGLGPFVLVVVCDECGDRSGEIARAHGARTLEARGGKVEAQRAAVRAFPSEIHVFCDADVTMEACTIHAIVQALDASPTARVAWPPKTPLPPVRRSRLARALHVYNLREGFAPAPPWFSGKLFAMRGWAVPSAHELAPRVARAPHDPSLGLGEGLRADDVYLSRHLLHAHGPRAIVRTESGRVAYRAPETLRGMYRYYRRLRLEQARVSALFPETRAVHGQLGRRAEGSLGFRAGPTRAPPEERRAFRLFQLALGACRVAYVADRLVHRHVLRRPCERWGRVEESKRVTPPRATPRAGAPAPTR